MRDIEYEIVNTWRWSLHDIDETDIESLIPFVMEYPSWKARKKAEGSAAEEIYADEADFLN